MASKHMERCSTLLIITKMQIKTIIRHHPKLISMAMVKKKKKTQINAEKDVEKGEHSHTIGGNINWSRHCGKKHGKKLKIEPSYDTAILLLGIYPKKPKTLIWKDICTPMFTEVLFTFAKVWKQPKSSSTGEWRKMWCI